MPLPRDSTASQEASTVSPNCTLSRKGLSQEESNSQAGNILVSPQAGMQTSNPLTRDSAASQEASTASPNSTPSGESLSQEGNNS